MTTWVKVYNSMPSHPKYLMAGDRAAWLAVCGLCYSNEHLTDGFIPQHALPVAAPGVKSAERLAARLVEVGLWYAVEGGWQIHGYREHQRSADEIRQRRAADAARKSATRSNGSPQRSPHGQIADSARNPAGVRSLDVDVDVEGREEEHLVAATPPLDPTEQAIDELCHLMSHHVRTAHGIDSKSREARVTKGWRDACRGMLKLDGYTREQVAFAIEWVCRHHYWRNRIKSMTRLRSEMGQVAKEIREQRDRGGQVVPIGRRQSASDLLKALDGGVA